MKKIINLLFILLFPVIAFSSEKMRDIVISKGDTFQLFSNPLKSYFDKKGNQKINGRKLPETKVSFYNAGYQATWELKNDSLYLISLVQYSYGKKPVFFDLEREFKTKKVFAKWFSASGLMTKGGLILYFNTFQDSIYEEEFFVSFEKGMLTKKTKYSKIKSYNSVFIEDQDSLKAFVCSKIDWSKVPSFGGKPQKITMMLYSGETKKLGNIELTKKSKINALNTELVRVMKALPEWSVFYKRGKVHHGKWIVSLIFTEEERKKYD